VTDVLSDNVVVIFFVKERAQKKIDISVDTPHSFPLTWAHSFPLTWALGMTSKASKRSWCW
jgi:hypothetical protein